MNINKHPLYPVWHEIFTRCYNKNSKDYKYYGKKGVTVCDRWSIKGGQGFRNFVKDMGERPNGYTLDRIDRNKNYCPENCRWATPLEQAKNRGIATSITYNGETLSVTEWAERLKVNREVLYHRLNYFGWDAKRTLETPISTTPSKRGPKIKVQYNDQELSVADIAKLCNVSKTTILRKLKMGWSVEKIISCPKTSWGNLKQGQF